MPTYRESQWSVMRRCLAIIRRLQRGAASRDQLIAAVYEQEGREAYSEGDALAKRFHNDLERIRSHLGFDLVYDWGAQQYVLNAFGDVALLDLPDEAIEAIAFLSETFDEKAPMRDKVHGLLDGLIGRLTEARRYDLQRQRSILQVDLQRTDADVIDTEIQEITTRACTERRRLEFLYRSPLQQDEQPRRHVVEPYELSYDTVRRHFYLRAYCLYTDGPAGRWKQEKVFRYRLGRILREELRILPDRFPIVPRPIPRYVVRYELKPEIARFGVTHYFEDTEVDARPDGSALVCAVTDDVFWATRTLIHYGAGCCILGGSEMLREMRRLVKEMAEVYKIEPEK